MPKLFNEIRNAPILNVGEKVVNFFLHDLVVASNWCSTHLAWLFAPRIWRGLIGYIFRSDVSDARTSLRLLLVRLAIG